MNSCNLTNKANLRSQPKVEIHTSKNYAILTPLLEKAKLFCLKCFVPFTRTGVFVWENFHPGYRDFGRKNRDLGNPVSPTSHMNTWKLLRRKEC